MASAIGDLVIGLGVDPGGVKRGVAEAKSAISGLASSAMGMATGVLAGFGAMAGIKMGGDLVSHSIGLAAAAEQDQVAFGVILGGAENAQKALADLNAFAASTPFEMPQLTKASRTLLAFKTSQEQLMPTLKALGDVAAGTGAPIEELALIYGKVRAKGKLSMEEINQLSEKGVPIMDELAKQFGVSTGEVSKLVEQGQVGFPNLQKAMASVTGEGGMFSGMMERQSQTLGGLWSTLKDSANIALRDIAAGILEAFDAKTIMTWAINSASTLVEWGKTVVDVCKGLAVVWRNTGLIAELVFNNAIIAILDAFPGLNTVVTNFFVTFRAFWAGIGAFASAIIGGMVNGFMVIRNVITSLIAGIGGMWDALKSGDITGIRQAFEQQFGVAFLNAMSKTKFNADPTEEFKAAFGKSFVQGMVDANRVGGISGGLKKRNNELYDEIAKNEAASKAVQNASAGSKVGALAIDQDQTKKKETKQAEHQSANAALRAGSTEAWSAILSAMTKPQSDPAVKAQQEVAKNTGELVALQKRQIQSGGEGLDIPS